VENVYTYTKFSGFVCEELCIPPKSKVKYSLLWLISKHFIKRFLISSTVKPIIYKHDMTCMFPGAVQTWPLKIVRTGRMVTWSPKFLGVKCELLQHGKRYGFQIWRAAFDNTQDNVNGAVIVTYMHSLLEFTRFFTRWMQSSARWLPTFGPSRPTRAINSPV